MWIDAFKGGPRTYGDFTLAGPICDAFNLAAISLRLGGRRLLWDAAAAKITNVPEANALLTREYREGWKILTEGRTNGFDVETRVRGEDRHGRRGRVPGRRRAGLRANPLGLPIGSQVYPTRSMLKDFPVYVKMMADIGVTRLELCSPIGYGAEFAALANGKNVRTIPG